MNCVGLLLTTVTVISCYSLCGELNIESYRPKRQDEVWGRNVQETSYSNNINDTSMQPNPCDPFVSTKPNFSTGRRISEAKCFEYIWELKNRDDKIRHGKACDATRAHLARPAVLGGRTTRPGEFPHMGALGWRAKTDTWLFMCGSSLISPKFLLTAAHCSKVSSRLSDVADPKPEIVRLGDKNIFELFEFCKKPEDKEILRFIVHPQYKSPKKYFDIGLIELKSEVTFHRAIQPACLWSKADTSPLGTTAIVTGWGTTDKAGKNTSPELQAASVDVMDSDTCNDLLQPVFNRNFQGIQPHQLCAGVLAGGIDTCQGDSGGPLQMKIPLPITTEGTMSYVIGVTSFGVGCARADTPGVYTRVSSFIDWIENIVWQ